MCGLKTMHPSVYEQFLSGHFTVMKTEQNNAAVKGDGGAVGLTEDPSALNRWMIC